MYQLKEGTYSRTQWTKVDGFIEFKIVQLTTKHNANDFLNTNVPEHDNHFIFETGNHAVFVDIVSGENITSHSEMLTPTNAEFDNFWDDISFTWCGGCPAPDYDGLWINEPAPHYVYSTSVEVSSPENVDNASDWPVQYMEARNASEFTSTAEPNTEFQYKNQFQLNWKHL